MATITKFGIIPLGNLVIKSLLPPIAQDWGRHNDSNTYLWHSRLGHVSNAKMKLISKACNGLPDLNPNE